MKYPSAVDNVTGVNCFAVLTGFADTLNGLFNGHILFKVDKLGGHYTAGCVIGVFKELVD